MISDAGRAAAEKAASGEAQTTAEFLLRHHPDHARLAADRRVRAVDAVRRAARRVRRPEPGQLRPGRAARRSSTSSAWSSGSSAMIMWAAPIGAFGAIAAVVGETGWSALAALGQIMLGFYITCFLFVVRRARLAAPRRHRPVDLQADEVPGPGVPAHRLDLLVGVGPAAAHRQDGAHGRLAARRRHHRAHRLLVQPRRHRHLPDDGVAVHRVRHGQPAVGGPSRSRCCCS